MGDMQRIAACLLLLCVASGVDLYTQKGKEARHFLIAADDLHLQFSSTPRIRELIRRTLRLSLRDADLVALVSTGASAINVPATSDLGVTAFRDQLGFRFVAQKNTHGKLRRSPHDS